MRRYLKIILNLMKMLKCANITVIINHHHRKTPHFFFVQLPINKYRNRNDVSNINTQKYQKER